MSVRFVIGASRAYAAVTLANLLSTLVSLPVMTRHFSVRDYGVVLLIANGSALINLLLGFSLGQALPTLFAATQDEAARRQATSTVMAAVTGVSFAVHAVIVLLARPLAEALIGDAGYATAMALGAISSFLSSLTFTLINVVRMNELHWTYFRVQLPAVVGQLGLLVALLQAGLGLPALYLAIGAANLWATLAFAVAVRGSLLAPPDRRVLARALYIARDMLPWQLAILLTTQSAGFFFVRAGRVEEGGLFSIAMSVAAVLAALSGSFNLVWTPYVLNRQGRSDLAQTQQRMFAIFSAGLLMLAGAIAVFAREIFAILAAPAFQAGFHFVPPLVMALAIFCFAQAFAQGLQARQQTEHYIWIGLATSGTFAATALALVDRLGGYGIIVAMAAGFLVMLGALQAVSQRLMPVAYPWARHALMWACASAIVWHAYPLGSSPAELGLKVAALGLLAALTYAFGAITRADLEALRAILAGSRKG